MSTLQRFAFLVLFIASCVLAPTSMEAHEPDQSYVFLRVYKEAINGRVELNSDDINRSVGSNFPKKGISDADVQPYIARMKAYLNDHLGFSNDGRPYTINFTDVEVFNLDNPDEADYVAFSWELTDVGEIPNLLTIKYNAVLDKNDKHRGALIVEQNWKAGIVDNHVGLGYIFTPSEPSTELDLEDDSIWKGFWALVKLGVWHIWIGLDHILFIVALILPGVVRRKPDEKWLLGSSLWNPVPAFKPAFLYIIKIVTFFTIAHSITLALAALDVVSLPSRYVESVIAFSIGLAALHNIIPIFRQKEWVIAFVFGLFHGFGFASVLGDKGLSSDFLAWSLLGFNVGVEIGQLLIICAVFPVLYLLRKTTFYRYLILFGSMLLILIALYWTIERFFEVDIPVFSLFY